MIWLIFRILSHSAVAQGFLILAFGNCRSIHFQLNLTQKFEILSKFQSFWAIVVICNNSGSKVRHTRWIFLGPQIALQMTCNGQISEPNPNEYVLARAFQGNLKLSPIFLELLTSYTHLFNTEPRFFIIIWNFPARANVYVVGTYLQVNIFICYVIMSKNARSLFSTMNKYR